MGEYAYTGLLWKSVRFFCRFMRLELPLRASVSWLHPVCQTRMFSCTYSCILPTLWGWSCLGMHLPTVRSDLCSYSLVKARPLCIYLLTLWGSACCTFCDFVRPALCVHSVRCICWLWVELSCMYLLTKTTFCIQFVTMWVCICLYFLSFWGWSWLSVLVFTDHVRLQ